MDITFETGLYQGHFDDSVFEPQGTYEFEESHEQEMRNMHHNIAALNAFLPVNHGYQTTSGRWGDFRPDFFSSEQHGNFQVENESSQAMAAPSFAGVNHTSSVWDGDDVDTAGCPEHPYVQHDQIVPIDEDVSEASGSMLSHSPVSNKSMPKASKSERARHAANQRHARPKRERVDSQQDGADAEHSEDRVGDKREKYREKNRVAAAKCRAKKKENTESLEGRARAFQARNSSLKRTERELRNELVNWQHAVLAHNAANSECTCDQLHDFNQRRARKLATGWDPTMSSPSQDSNSSIAASPEFVDAGMVPFSRVEPTVGSQQQMSVAPPHYQLNQSSRFGSMRMATDSELVNGQQFPAFLQSNADGR